MSSNGSQQDLFREAPVWYEGLTGRRRLFVEYFCAHKDCFLNATAAYVKAYGGGSGKELAVSSVQSNAARLTRDPKIKDAINRLLKSRQSEEDVITEYKTLNLLKTLSFYNPADIVDPYGNIKVKEDLGELGELAFCVTGIKKTKNTREIKLFDRVKSLALLINYFNSLPPDEARSVNPVVRIAAKDIDELKPEETETGATDAEYEVVGEQA